ncbi:MAG: DNA recombination protein RmuC [Bacteroides sp.]|nr:DNA recombination protein RmuC [Bacteroides sp.]MBD5372680.1 DNA recombination protein RmuC [Bacteroides sp.]
MIAGIIILSLLLLGAIIYIMRLTAEKASLQARIESSEQNEEKFQSIAGEIMNRQRADLRSETSAQMQMLLEPLRREMDTFSRTVSEKYSREASERFALREKVDELRELNMAIGQETRRLYNALRGNNKEQGKWGELVLQTILENAGLTEGREFVTQQVAGDLRPDVVVNFPGAGCVVIDSKTSMTSYMAYCDAETEEQRQIAAKGHVASVRRHIDELARKNYQAITGRDKRLEFVMMFMPNEGAYLAAMQFEPGLWEEAYRKQVIIISPTHLLSVLRLVQQMWRHDAQNKNALAIAEEAGKMYDKFIGFVDNLSDVEKKLAQASEALSRAQRQLDSGPGNLASKALKLKEMGAKTSK